MTSADLETMRSGKDVVTFLKGQHEQIKSLFEQVLNSTGDERENSFVALRRLLAVHETAEEEIVHPKAKQTIEGGEHVVEQRLQEENQAKQTLAELEKMDVNTAEFEVALREFRNDVVEHAEAEEHQEFDKLADALEPAQLEKMRSAAKMAEAMAPTHPHAGVESAAKNMLAGPFAAMLDRARDVLTGKTNSA